MTSELIWQSIASPGWEHVRVQEDHPGWTVFDSIFVREDRGKVLRGGYTLVIDKAWRTLELRLMVESNPGVMDGIHILSNGDGTWMDANEQPMPQLDGCFDVDIKWTPLTNSLPINRIPLEIGGEHQLKVAYVSLPDLSITSVTQRYTRSSENLVTYSSETREFECDLTIDHEGFVTQYPELFIRTWPN